MKDKQSDFRAALVIAGSAAFGIGATALLLGAQSAETVTCAAEVPNHVSIITISGNGGVAVQRSGEVATLTLCGEVEDQGRKRRKRRTGRHAHHEQKRIRAEMVLVRERAEEARDRAREAKLRAEEVHLRLEEAMERTEEERRRAIERAVEALGSADVQVDGEQIEQAVERALMESARALESVDDAAIETQIEAQMRALEKRLEASGEGQMRSRPGGS